MMNSYRFLLSLCLMVYSSHSFCMFGFGPELRSPFSVLSDTHLSPKNEEKQEHKYSPRDEKEKGKKEEYKKEKK